MRTLSDYGADRELVLTAFLLALLFAPVSLAFNLFVIATSPLWAFIAAALNTTELPWPLSWVHTHDDDIYGSRTTETGIPASFYGRFRRALWWLVRNPGYGFDAYVLGYPTKDLVDIDTKSSGQFGGAKLAWAYSTIRFKNRTRFLFRADVPLIAGRYLKFWLGWHIHNQAGRHMFKVDFSPFKKAE